MKLALHSGIGITPGVKILSELPRFTLLTFGRELEAKTIDQVVISEVSHKRFFFFYRPPRSKVGTGNAEQVVLRNTYEFQLLLHNE